MGKADKEFGSQADLIQNEAGMDITGSITENPNKGVLTRVESKRSEFETVSFGESFLAFHSISYSLRYHFFS